MDANVKTMIIAALAACALPAAAMNRCLTPEGRVVYTDSPCGAIGAKPHGRVRDSISVVPSPAPKVPPPEPNAASPAQKPGPAQPERYVRPAVFRKSEKAPTLTVCYDPRKARNDAPLRDVEAAIKQGLALWNAGCNINYRYLGQCPLDEGLWQRERADYRVAWSSWDNSLTLNESPELARQHAIAMASPVIGVELNRDIWVPAWRLEQAITHEFGHVVGVKHSKNPGDLMYYASKQRTPTAADYEMCNQAIEANYGIKAEFR
jgi:hypothetical protein